MSKIFLITYDLKEPGQDYSELYEAIKGLGDWQHPIRIYVDGEKSMTLLLLKMYMTLCVHKLMKMIYCLS